MDAARLAQPQDEDASQLKLGPGTSFLSNDRKMGFVCFRSLLFALYLDFQKAVCLLNSDVAILLEHRQQLAGEDAENELSKYVFIFVRLFFAKVTDFSQRIFEDVILCTEVQQI